VPRTLSKFGEHMQVLLPGTAFQSTFVAQSTPATFRRHLKTFLFAEVS